MSKNERATESRSVHHCPACHRPVGDVIERRKSMGVTVPVWVAGPCHNPECTAYIPEHTDITSVRGSTWHAATDW
ncbi:hypothetical protein ACRAR1_01000 [Streptomyces sanyensis]|uniref:hypothetical protein n=1 Tax=Streptomyces sanyensis TaxID=568869 RepID=UPI003D775F43